MTPGEGRSPAACRSPDAVAPSRSRPDTEQEEVAKKSLGRHSPVCSSPGGGGNNLVRISLAECLRARQDVAPRSPLQFHPRKQNRLREPVTRMKQHRPHGWVTHAHPRGLCARLRGQGGEGRAAVGRGGHAHRANIFAHAPYVSFWYFRPVSRRPAQFASG